MLRLGKRVSEDPPAGPVDQADVDAYLDRLGQDGPRARDLDLVVDRRMETIRSLSPLTAPLAVDYLDRMARPIPDLTPEQGAQIMGRAYVAHLVTEDDPARFGARDVPVLGTLPPLRRGAAPQGLLVRVVKASRRDFEVIRAVPTPVWDGFIRILTRRTHDLVPEGAPVVSLAVVDGLARVGWVFRQVDIHYGLAPEAR